ncbi:MAG TPA: NADH-quinone oxidoreductase subunit N, partial [Chloroflexota bacterium]|nr:NADH-quinone oxidoreductase subunit N [Chloroflexota bacterium]
NLGFYAMVVNDHFGLLMQGVILIGAILVVLLSMSYVRREELEQGEYYALILLAVVGMMFMAASADLIMIFLTLEVFSIALYILSAFARARPKSEEAGMKYLLLGSFSSAFLVYGIALIYGTTGTTNMLKVAGVLATPVVRGNALLLAGTGLLLIGLGFKVSAVPFQVWTPDVYEGAPISVSAFMSVGTKVAAFAAIVRVFIQMLPSIRVDWLPIVWALSALTMIVGNLIAIAQPGIKRMLAYSSIAHAGYVLVGIAAASRAGVAAVPFYMLAYAFMTLGAWMVVVLVARKGEIGVDLQDYSGLFWRNPGVAVAMGLFMFSLAGIPPTAGFTSKFTVFYAGVEQHLIGLVVIGVVTTLISIYYYLRVTVLMFMNRPEGEVEPIRVPASIVIALVIASLGTLALGVYPAPFIQLAQRVVPFGF